MWAQTPKDIWHEVADSVAAAAKVAELGARSVFLTLGRRDLDAFAALDHVRFLVRLIESPDAPLPVEAEIVTGRGPFDVATEEDLMARHGIDALVTKASGGKATEGKILAARARRVPVVMIRRPALPPGETAASVAEALRWLESRLA
jgi:precorrin-6A/cobalt-precorrin-6A reductase